MDQENARGRLAYLFDWLNPNKWFPSKNAQFPTRVIRKLSYHNDEEDEIVQVVINPSRVYQSHWAPIIEVNRETIYLNDHPDIVPELPQEWYNCPNLAKLAAFEFLWPTSTENWDGAVKYFEDMDYVEYYEWRYRHPPP